MEITANTPHRDVFVFVCEKQRPDKKCCMPEGARLTELLKSKVNEAGLTSKVRIVRTGCLDVCEKGPNILIEPAHRMFHCVRESDIDSIIHHVSKAND